MGKIQTLNFAIQAGKIRSLFPSSDIFFNQNILKWKYSITPSPLSDTYDIKMIYVRDKHPNVYVVSPQLDLFPGETRLPHVYSTEQQWLCLYYRKTLEWRSDMIIANTIIPWTSEWLIHYEFWLGNGKWRGGGTHSEPKA